MSRANRMSQKIFTSNTSWTAQAGVYFVEIEGIGAGGGGAGGRNGTTSINNSPLGGGGGAAGIMSKITIPVVPGTSYDIVIGAAGSAGSAGAIPTNGGIGTNTTFSITAGATLATFMGGGGGYAHIDALLNHPGYNTYGGAMANEPITYFGDTTHSLGISYTISVLPKIMIGEGGFGGETLIVDTLIGTAGSNALVYNASGFAGGSRGTTGTDSTNYYGGGAGGGGAASYYGSGGVGGNGGNGNSTASATNGTTGSAPGATAYGAGGGGGGAGGCGFSSAGTAGNGGAGASGYLVLRWRE